MLKNVGWIIVLSTLITLMGCATPPPINVKQDTEMKQDFASGIGVVVDYVSDGEKTFIVVNMDNPENTGTEVWLSQTYFSVGAETSRKSRIISSNQSLVERVIRAPALEKGVKEVIVVEVFDTQGRVLFQTKPIVNDNGFSNNSPIGVDIVSINDAEYKHITSAIKKSEPITSVKEEEAVADEPVVKSNIQPSDVLKYYVPVGSSGAFRQPLPVRYGN